MDFFFVDKLSKTFIDKKWKMIFQSQRTGLMKVQIERSRVHEILILRIESHEKALFLISKVFSVLRNTDDFDVVRDRPEPQMCVDCGVVGVLPSVEVVVWNFQSVLVELDQVVGSAVRVLKSNFCM